MLAVELTGSSLVVRKPDGSAVSGPSLAGAVLLVDTEAGSASVRIDAVRPDELDASGETVLYEASVVAADGGVSPLCPKDPWGAREAVAIEGFWDERATHRSAPGRFELLCTAGAAGKCVRSGYKPWKGSRAFDLHQACTRLMRADYCGDGSSHTRDGTVIDLFDRDGIQRDEPSAGMTFEAAWGVGGALCVARTRVPSLFDMAALRRACPGSIGPDADCTETAALADARALVFDRTGPNP